MQISAIIPVYNQWPLTRACLLSLAEHTDGQACDVILVDNASSDATAAEAPALGRDLFGDRFLYHRFETNRNFGPACNVGARLSSAEYLLFLNNDIVLRPGWLDPLLADFSRYPDIAGVGPLLMYPAETPLGPAVQHLGVVLSPLRMLAHLYHGIPAASALAGKRRFFQMITAACLLMPRRLFQDVGAFDEAFINGFEDIDLCARLSARGYRFTVNPASRVFHHTSQTPGRKKHEIHNAVYLHKRSAHLLRPDLETYLADDGLEYRLSPWLTWENVPLASARRSQRPPDGEGMAGPSYAVKGEGAESPEESEAGIRALILEQPYRMDALIRLADLCMRRGDVPGALGLWNYVLTLSPREEYRLRLTRMLARLDPAQALAAHLPSLLTPCRPVQAYRRQSEDRSAALRAVGQPEAAQAYESWLDDMPRLYRGVMLPYYRDLSALLAEYGTGLETRVSDAAASCLWLASGQDALHAALYGPQAAHESDLCAGQGFSLLSVADAGTRALRSSLEALQAQSCPDWEWLIVCAPGQNGQNGQSGLGRDLIDLAEREPRVRLLTDKDLIPQAPSAACASPQSAHAIAADASLGMADQACGLNAALALARNELILHLRPGDRLAPEALSRMALSMRSHPEARLAFADEEHRGASGAFSGLLCKPLEWDPLLLFEGLGEECLGRAVVWRRDALCECGGWVVGYPGAEAYALALRCAESSALAAPGAVIHIPEVLLQRALPDAVKAPASPHVPDASGMEDGGRNPRFRLKALQHSLKRQGIRGRALLEPSFFDPASYLVRAQGDFPDPAPRVTLIMDASRPDSFVGVASEEAAERIGAGTDYPDWDFCLAGLPESAEAHSSCALSLNRAAAAARGEALLFLAPGLAPLAADWLKAMLGLLMLGTSMGAAMRARWPAILGAALLRPDGRVDNLGFGADHAGLLTPLYRGLAADAPGYLGLARTARTLHAVDPRLLLIRKADFERLGGFDPAFDPAPAFDLCLRAARLGLRAAVCPQARFRLDDASPPPWDASLFSRLRQAHGSLYPLIPALLHEDGNSPLHWLPHPVPGSRAD